MIEKAITSAAKHSRSNAAAIRSDATPSVVHLADKTCVELPLDGGHYAACYDRRGDVIEESMSVVN